MPSKKRRLTFDLDDVEKRSEETQRAILELNKALENCHIAEALNFLDPEEFLNFATVKCGYSFVQDLLLTLSAVPEECEPWRAELTRKLFMYSRGKMSLHNDEDSVVKAFLQYSSFKSEIYKQTECYNAVFSKCICNSLRNTTMPATIPRSFITAETDKFVPFAGCIAPPAKVCLLCDQELQKHNNPCVVTYYLPSGPLPFLKVELRCRTCGINYGIVKYGNSTEGYKHYDGVGVIEASDVVYIDRLVMQCSHH